MNRNSPTIDAALEPLRGLPDLPAAVRAPRRFDEPNELLIVVTGIAAGQPP